MSLAETLEELARHAALPPRALPPACYLDPEYWAAEQERVLRPGWHAVARADELLEEGDYRGLELFGEPFVLVRDSARRLRVFSRVCLHRAAVFAEGAGNAKRFTCPYHLWGYDLEGRLCAAPLMDEVEGFERDAHRLPELALEEWQGFVFVNLDPDAAPLAPGLEQIEGALTPIDLKSHRLVGVREYDSPWNWKILVENFMESYHHLGTHATTLQPRLPAARTHAIDVPGEGALLVNSGIDGDPGVLIGLVFPTLMFVVSQDEKLPFAAWFEMQIDAADHFRLRIHALLPAELASNDDLASAISQSLDEIHNEDIETCDRVWRGLSSRLFRPTSLAKQEDCLVRFHRYLARQMKATAG